MKTKSFSLTESAFSSILHSELFRLGGVKIDLPESILALRSAIESEYDENDDSCAMWYLGESGECCLSDFIAGSYWSLTEWHAGQFSPEYAALCALGQIFKPGMTSPPENEDEPEWTAYDACNQWFSSRGKI